MNNLRTYRRWSITSYHRYNCIKWIGAFQGMMLVADSEIALHLKIEAKAASMREACKKRIVHPSKEKLAELMQMA